MTERTSIEQRTQQNRILPPSIAPDTSIGVGHIQDHGTNLGKCKIFEIGQSMFSDLNGIKLETNSRKISEKNSVWTLNNMLKNKMYRKGKAHGKS